MAKYTKQQYVTERIKYFYETKRSYELAKTSFDDEKYEFYEQMDKYFDEVADDDGKYIIDMRDTVKGVKKIICQKVSSVSIEFDIKKLDNFLNKEQRKKVIHKRYSVINWPKLFNLLKESGVEWKKFLQCVEVKEEVLTKELDKLVELGEVDIDDIKSCSKAKIKSQFYKITEK